MKKRTGSFYTIDEEAGVLIVDGYFDEASFTKLLVIAEKHQLLIITAIQTVPFTTA